MAINDSLISKKNEANEILASLNQTSSEIKSRYTEADKLLKGITVDSEDAKNLKRKLSSIIESTNENIHGFNKEKARLNRLLNEVNKFYEEKYTPLINKINDKQSGLNASIEKCTQAKSKSSQYQKNCEEQYTQIKQHATELKIKSKELEVIDRKIRKFESDTQANNQKALQATNSIKTLEKSIIKVHSELVKLYDHGDDLERKIVSLHESAVKELNDIVSIKSSSESLLNEIKNLYEIASDTGLGGEFDKRRKHLKDEMSKWESKIFQFTLILLAIVFAIFIGQLGLYGWNIKDQTFDVNFYVRFLLASPIVFYIYFCTIQHSHASKLHDKYGFKTTLSATIRSHLYLLSDHELFSDDEDARKILDFIIEGFKIIYAEPANDDDYKVKLKLASMEMNIEKRIIKSLSKTVQDIPEPCKLMFSEQQSN